MAKLLRDRLLLTWALLAAVTLVSFEIAGRNTAMAVLAIAFAKAWLVMREFMELRGAPLALRLFATGWIVAALAILLSILAGAFH